MGGFGKADLRTKASFAFIDVAIFPSESLRVGVVFNCSGLVYFKAVQQWFCCSSFCRNFC